MNLKDPNADPLQLRNPKLKSPYIIAQFSTLTEHVAYFVDIQDGFFPVSSEIRRKFKYDWFTYTIISLQLPPLFSFVQAIDFLIKLHHVFNFEYCKETTKMMQFFEYVVYGMQQSKRFLTAKMLEVANLVVEAEHANDE